MAGISLFAKRIFGIKLLLIVTIIILLTFNFSLAQVVPPKVRGTPTTGLTIDQAQREDYMGPKAGIALTKFFDKSAKWGTTGQMGDAIAEMLGNALFATNRAIVLERQSLGDVIQGQDLGASGRIRT